MISDALARTEKLKSGGSRSISWVEFGDPAGRPLIHFHGTGLCRLEALTGTEIAARNGVRLIAFDRPGFGDSRPALAQGLGAVADDALALADHLALRSFAVSGFSGGFPHALATAARAQHRCRHIVSLNTAGDAGDPAWRAISPPMRLMLTGLTHPRVAKLLWPRLLAAFRREVAEGPAAESTRILQAAVALGSSQGHEAALHELSLFYRSGWGNLWDQATAPVTLLHGADDGMLPFAKDLAASKPNTSLIEVTGRHFDWATSDTWQLITGLVLEA